MITSDKNFKTSNLPEEYKSAPLVLQMIIDDFFSLSYMLGIEAVCVRIYGKHPGDSGVHLDERAVDFRDEYNGSFLYSKEQTEFIIKFFNSKYKRIDGFQTCIHHSFDGGPMHFHLQIPADIKNLRRQ